MEKSITGLEEAISLRGFTIIPVWKMSLYYSLAFGFAVFASKEPKAVVFCGPKQTKALNLNGEELPVENLIAEIPGLKEMLEIVKNKGSK